MTDCPLFTVHSPVWISIVPLAPLVSAVWPLQGLEQCPLRVTQEVPGLDLGNQQLGQVAVGGGEVIVGPDIFKIPNLELFIKKQRSSHLNVNDLQ